MDSDPNRSAAVTPSRRHWIGPPRGPRRWFDIREFAIFSIVMKLYDTAAKAVVPFEPEGPIVTMYTCGITPYDATHLGHASVYIT